MPRFNFSDAEDTDEKENIKYMMKEITHLIEKLPVWLGLWLMLCLTACSNDEEDYTYPSIVSEFADVDTDASGRLVSLLTDGGDRLSVANASAISTEGVTPDTVYRTLVQYVPLPADDGTDSRQAQLYTVQAIPAPLPLPPTDFPDGVKADPLEMQSLWRGGNYLNMILLVKAQKGKHTFCFVEDSLTVSPTDGHAMLHLRLYHDAGDDVQAYTQKSYLSVPLSHYADRLSTGDSINLRIPTAKGWQEWKRGY